MKVNIYENEKREKIIVKCNYNKEVINFCKQREGKWNGKEWELPINFKNEVISTLKKLLLNVVVGIENNDFEEIKKHTWGNLSKEVQEKYSKILKPHSKIEGILRIGINKIEGKLINGKVIIDENARWFK